MKDWKEIKLENLGEIITGKTPSRRNPEDWGNEMLFITPTDYGGYRKFAYFSNRNLSRKGIKRLKNKVLPKNSILVTCIGSQMGLVVMNKKKAITNQQINSIIPKSEIADHNFLYYTLKGMQSRLRVLASGGTAVPILNKGDFEKIKILLPPLPEQRAIAAVLSSLDDKIDLLHRQNETLEAMAETLFREWFIEQADEDWEEGTLDDLIEIKYGKAHRKLLDGNIPVYGSGGIMRYANKALYKKESVLIPRKGTLNNVIYINKPFWTVDTMFYTEMKKPNTAKFIYQFIKTINLVSMNVGSAVPSITTKVLRSIPIKIPTDAFFEIFENSINPLYQKKEINKSQIRTLTQLRDTLLPKLMSGEIRVKETEVITD